MTDWVVVLVPLLVLPIILLFRFVGCGLNTKGDVEIPLPERPIPPEAAPVKPVPTQAPSYSDTIVAEPGVIAYWRLVDDPSNIPADGSPPEAKDEKNFQSGKYIKVPGGLPLVEPGAEAGSEPADGNFDLYQTSLIAKEPAATTPATNCRSFKGGYVLVDFKAGLYTDEFTIEAWIKPQWIQKATGYEHTLIGAGGYYVRTPVDQSPSWHGFRIFALVSADGADNKDQDRWRVYLAQDDGSGEPVKMIPVAPIVAHNTQTHLAVTLKTTGEVIIFVDGKNMANGTVNAYSRPDGAPLFIGVKNIESDPANPSVPRNPVMSPIQEVVLYSKALPPEVIKKHYDIGIGKGDA
jgi:Concanavalin A-like lectin/glucanases superfamily